MKVTTNKSTKFTPVSISITFESQNELDAFGNLFNTASVANALRIVFGVYFDGVYQLIDSVGGAINGKTHEITQAIKKY